MGGGSSIGRISYAARRPGYAEAYKKDRPKRLDELHPEIMSPEMFVSFQHDNKSERSLLDWQSESGQVNFKDTNSKKSYPQKRWKQIVYTKIKNSDGLIVVNGEKTAKSEAVHYEIETAHALNKPVIGMHASSKGSYPVPETMRKNGDTVINWDLDRLQTEIDEKVTFSKGDNDESKEE